MNTLVERMIAAGRPDDEIAAVRERDELKKLSLLENLREKYLAEKTGRLELEIGDAYDRIAELERQLDRALPGSSAPVEICPECDISDCKHIRESRN